MIIVLLEDSIVESRRSSPRLHRYHLVTPNQRVHVEEINSKLNEKKSSHSPHGNFKRTTSISLMRGSGGLHTPGLHEGFITR